MSNNLELGNSGSIMQSNQIKPQKMFQSCLSNRLPQYVLVFLLLGFLFSFSFPDQTSAQVSGYSTQYREDYNGDGEVSVADVISLIMMIRTAGYIQQADYTNDGKCDIMDAIALLINIVRDKLTSVQAEPVPVELDPVQIVGPLVVSSNWPECTDLVTWLRDILRLDGVEQASETAQAVSFYTWLRLFARNCYGGMQQAYEGLPGAEKYVTDPVKNLFVYGWGYCDTFSRIAEAAGQNDKFQDKGIHTTCNTSIKSTYRKSQSFIKNNIPFVECFSQDRFYYDFSKELKKISIRSIKKKFTTKNVTRPSKIIRLPR